MEDDYLMIFSLVKNTWKKSCIAKDSISSIVSKYVKANNIKGFYYRKTPQAREKY